MELCLRRFPTNLIPYQTNHMIWRVQKCTRTANHKLQFKVEGLHYSKRISICDCIFRVSCKCNSEGFKTLQNYIPWGGNIKYSQNSTPQAYSNNFFRHLYARDTIPLHAKTYERLPTQVRLSLRRASQTYFTTLLLFNIPRFLGA